MELEFETIKMQMFAQGGEQVVAQEETMETIVPDYCPDIARIIQTDGAVFIHNRQVREGKGEVQGTVRITVLYVPEGAGGIRTLEFALPFTTQAEGMTGCSALWVQGEIESLDSRTLNPRKLFTHCKLVTRLVGYRPHVGQICTNVVGGDGIETQVKTQKAVVLTQMVGKECTFSEQVNLSPAKGGATEILSSKVRPQVGEVKIMGSKLIFKGIFLLNVLYATGTGAYCTLSQEVPFSQIMEIADGATMATVQLLVSGCDIQMDGADPEGRLLSMTLYAQAVAMVRQEQSWTLLHDMYSTQYDVSYETTMLTVHPGWESIHRRQTVREVLEIGVVAKQILACSVDCSPVQVNRQGNLLSLRTTATIKALYTDEGDAPLLAHRSVEVTTQLELPPEYSVVAQADCMEEVQCILGDRGMEVRFGVAFAGEAKASVQCSCITSAQLDKSGVKDVSQAPSLVLRCLRPNETLWMLAKGYHTTMDTILVANHLESEGEIPQNQLLLIPKKRG